MKDILEKIERFMKGRGLVSQDRAFSKKGDIATAFSKDVGERQVAFDTECIWNPDDYDRILQGFKRACGGSNQFEIVSTYFDHEASRAGIWIRMNGHEFKGDWSQAEDWVSDEFLSILAQVDGALIGGFARLFLGQDYYAIYLENKSDAEELSGLFSEL